MIQLTEEEAAQLVSDSLVLQEAIGAGLLDNDTAAALQLDINPSPWFVARAVERSKREINADIAIGLVPADVKSFSTLYLYVDANEYGGLTEDEKDWSGAECEAVHKAVDEWLRAGR